MFKQNSNRRAREARRGSAFCPQAKFRMLSAWNCKIYAICHLWIMWLWNICWLVKIWLTWGRMEAKQTSTRTQEGFCQVCTKIFARLYLFLVLSLISACYNFSCSEFDSSISCDAEDLSWRRDVREGIVFGRWVSWLFCRLNTWVLWCQFGLDLDYCKWQ